MWDCTSPLAILQKKTNLRRSDGDFSHRNVFCYSGGKGNGRPYAVAKSQYFQVNLMTPGESSLMVHANLECPKVSNKISFFEPDGGNYTHSLFSRFKNHGSNIPNESCKPKNPATTGIPYDLISIYRWMSGISASGLKQQLNSTLIENKKSCEWSLFGDINPTSYCSLGSAGDPANNLTIGSADYIEITKYMDSSPSQRTTVVANADMTSLPSDPFLKNLQMTEANGFDVKTPHSRFHGDYYVNNLAAHGHIYKECKYKNEDDQLHLEQKSQQNEFAMADKTEIEVCSTTNNKPHFGLAKQEHAFAGALAGIFVSLCLHPVDTIKTVIQSCHADQRSINYIGRSIISERGVTGLYRGIASNITSSAPISAIYTFTYESVKGVLLPFLPKEHQSFAHCMAGGCASIATSFVFTPSERIKQQMQVGSHYQNCWTAFVGIIRKGGLPSLYTGWGAVLCRNVPHSIIKFYTYESLKQLMLSSPKPNAQPNTLQTLLCGGLAGSTAALFTTPFDVVKTRLQTQIPGSIHQYDGVFNTLVKIGKHEGLKGLYRGLTPRLVMYISQGAIFFASYESFKRLLSQEMPQIYALTIGYLQSMEDEAP